MSFEATAIVLNHSQARGTAKLVLIGIASHEGDGGSWPSVATLARYANVSPRNVQVALRQLELMGEIVTELQGGGPRGANGGGSNRYRVTVRCPYECDRSSQHRVPKLQLRFGPKDDQDTGDAYVTPDDSITRGATTASPGGRRQHHPNLSSNQPGNPSARTQPQSDTEPVDNHRCDRGWLPGEDDDGRRQPCLVCKPHLASRL